MKPPHDEHIDLDAYEALRQDRDRCFQMLIEKQQYIRQLENQVSTLKNQLKMKDQQSSGGTTIKCKTYIAELKNDIHDNHNCSIYAVPPSSAEDTPPASTRGRSASRATDFSPESPRLKKLFLNEFGDEHTQRTAEEHNRFMNFITDHHWGQLTIDSRRDNRILQSIVCFCIKWRRIRYIKDPVSPAAVLRFLTDTCGFACEVERATISTVLGKMLKAEHNKELYFDMENYF